MTDEQTIAQRELTNYLNLQKNIKDLNNKLEVIETRMHKTTSSTDKIIVQGGNMDKADLICQHLELAQLFERESQKAVIRMLSIEQNIQQITDMVEQRILRNKYLYARTFEQIAVFENICYRQIRRLHKKALRSYYQTMNIKEEV